MMECGPGGPRIVAVGAFGLPRQPPFGSDRGQSFFGTLGNQIPFDLYEQTKHRDHHLGLHVLRAVELHVLFDGHEPHPLLDIEQEGISLSFPTGIR